MRGKNIFEPEEERRFLSTEAWLPMAFILLSMARARSVRAGPHQLAATQEPPFAGSGKYRRHQTGCAPGGARAPRRRDICCGEHWLKGHRRGWSSGRLFTGLDPGRRDAGGARRLSRPTVFRLWLPGFGAGKKSTGGVAGRYSIRRADRLFWRPNAVGGVCVLWGRNRRELGASSAVGVGRRVSSRPPEFSLWLVRAFSPWPPCSPVEEPGWRSTCTRGEGEQKTKNIKRLPGLGTPKGRNRGESIKGGRRLQPSFRGTASSA